VKEVERSDRGENRPFYRYSPVLAVDAQELQQRLNVQRIYHTSDPYNPRENMHHPSLIYVVV
jgi:hypothetical protein